MESCGDKERSAWAATFEEDYPNTNSMSEESKRVECSTHGDRYPAYVCQHLNLKTPVGFYEPFTSDSSVLYSDDELNAWCDACDKVLTRVGKWNEESEIFAKIKLVCDVCFFDMKELNTGSRNG